MSLRLVVDTNVLVSAVLWSGRDAEIITKVRTGACEAFTSDWLLAELLETLQEKKLEDRMIATGLTPETAFRLVVPLLRVVEPVTLEAPIRDPDDLHVLAAAVAAEANMIVSKDRDLLVLGEFRGIPILNVDQAADTLGIPRGH